MNYFFNYGNKERFLMNELKYIEPFRFWCQTVMPTVYDDSLSYYELLNKVAAKLNEVINACNATSADVTELTMLFDKLNDYVLNYFANLDVQEEINRKLDEMVENGTLDRILSKFFGVFVTPQMYGAKGDGVTDDTVAINTCLAQNKFVFIPSGTYLVSNTIMLNTSVKNTVMCTSTTRIKANKALKPVLMFGNDDGFNAMYFSWDGGIIDCGGFDNCVGVRFTQYSTASYVDNMVVENFGKDSVGVGICDDLADNYPSIQLNIGRLRIKDYSDVTKPNVINTGMVIKAYDFEISSLYIYGCTVGIDCKGGSLIHINDYHYWVGNNDNIQFIGDNYLKTVALLNEGSINFDLFYSDQAYVAVKGGHMTANYSHIIAINPTAVDSGGGAVNAYVVEITNNYKDVDFGTVTINKNGNDNVHAIKNSKGMPLYRFVNDRPVTGKYKYETEAVPTASILFNICNEPLQHCFLSGDTIVADKWYRIGYVPKTNGNYQILINSSSNQCQAKVDVDVTSYSCVVRRAVKMLSNVGDISFSVSNNTTEIDGFQFYTVYIRFSQGYDNLARLFSNTTGVGGFYRCPLGMAVDGEVDDSRTVICYSINDNSIKTLSATTTGITLNTGYNRVTLTSIPIPPSQYYFTNIVTKMYSNKSPLNVAISLYHSDNTVDVYSDNNYTDVEITVEYEFTLRPDYM